MSSRSWLCKTPMKLKLSKGIVLVKMAGGGVILEKHIGALLTKAGMACRAIFQPSARALTATR